VPWQSQPLYGQSVIVHRRVGHMMEMYESGELQQVIAGQA